MDHQPFLDAIRAAPDDDLPRLVYADWLDETGGEVDRARAELIRVQCEADRLPPRARRRLALGRRSDELLADYHDWWVAPLRKAWPGARGWKFRRGFPHHVTTSATGFAGRSAALFTAAPTVRAATFANASNEITALVAGPGLARLAEVDLSRMCSCGGCPVQEQLRELFASPRVAGLTVLRVARDRLDDAAVARLADSPHLAGLVELDLSGNAIGPAGVVALATSTHLHRLTRLDLSGNHLGADGVSALADPARLPGLSHLTVRRHRLSADQLGHLRGRFGRNLKA